MQRRYLAEGEYDATAGALIYGVDQLGSVRDVIGGGGTLSNHFDYDPYGNTTATTGSAGTGTDFRYSGLFYHATSGLYLATHRAYDPTIGRWLSRDPINEQGGVNHYRYVGGDPLKRTDPLGLYGGEDDLVVIGVGAVAGLTGRIFADAFHGNLSSFRSYLGATIGGAAAAEATYYGAVSLGLTAFQAYVSGGALGGIAANFVSGPDLRNLPIDMVLGSIFAYGGPWRATTPLGIAGPAVGSSIGTAITDSLEGSSALQDTGTSAPPGIPYEPGGSITPSCPQ